MDYLSEAARSWISFSNCSLNQIPFLAAVEGFALTSLLSHDWSLNGTMESKIALTMLAMIPEIERDLISERTKRVEGEKSSSCKARKTQGAKKFKTSLPNLYNWLKINKFKTQP